MQLLPVSSVFGMLVAIIVVFAWIAFYFRDKYNNTRDELLDLANARGFFSKRASIMRKDERILYNILLSLYGNSYFIFPQIHLSELLDIKNDVKEHDNLFREIDHYSVDYAIFDKINIAPLLAIELNGGSHFIPTRKNRDKKVSNILLTAGIRFLTIPVQKTYDEDELKKQINPLL